MDEWPKITGRQILSISPWMKVIAREVEFEAGSSAEIYYAVHQLDYLTVLAVTPQGDIPIVRQYRPAMEAFAWELPGGLLEPGEDPAVGAARELLEETGYPTLEIVSLGINSVCASRMSNRIHSFFAKLGDRISDFKPESRIEARTVSPNALAELIRAGEFSEQLHLGTLLQASLKGFFELPRG